MLTQLPGLINELATMLHGGQIGIPAFTGFKGGNISDTPLASSVYASANLAEQNYQQKISQQNAMMGGIAALGGAILGAPTGGGSSVAGSIYNSFQSGVGGGKG